jgi:hypothetical protein
VTTFLLSVSIACLAFVLLAEVAFFLVLVGVEEPLELAGDAISCFSTQIQCKLFKHGEVTLATFVLLAEVAFLVLVGVEQPVELVGDSIDMLAMPGERKVARVWMLAAGVDGALLLEGLSTAAMMGGFGVTALAPFFFFSLGLMGLSATDASCSLRDISSPSMDSGSENSKRSAFPCNTKN